MCLICELAEWCSVTRSQRDVITYTNAAYNSLFCSGLSDPGERASDGLHSGSTHLAKGHINSGNGLSEHWWFQCLGKAQRGSPGFKTNILPFFLEEVNIVLLFVPRILFIIL
jgi:hypothetical protein